MARRHRFYNAGRITRFARKGAERRYSYEANSNRLQAIMRTLRITQAGRERDTQDSQVSYELDANGALISDGVRRFDYDASGRLEAVRFMQSSPGGGNGNGHGRGQGRGHVQPQAQRIDYLHNALGQRVFKGEPRADDPTPQEQNLGQRFIDWLRRLFAALFLPERAATSVGTAYLYGDTEGPIPAWAMLGEYDNGSAQGKGASEYLWLPTEDGGAIPVGLYRRGRLYAIHPDHLGTPRLMTDDDNEVVWQWPYSAFGDNSPTGILRASNQQPARLRATESIELSLRMPGQYFDEETGTFQNYFRDYDPAVGRYRQADPIGLAGGINRFAYVGGNPIGLIDPDGRNAVFGGRVGASAGFALAGPAGAVVGGLAGAGVGAAIGWWATGPMLQEKTPNTGEPGEWHTNPGDGKPASGQERLYGPNGQPEVDIDWHPDHGAGKPHGHNWDNGRRGRGVPLSPWPRGRIINGCQAP